MPPEPLTRTEISKEYLNFSAGHLTINCGGEREHRDCLLLPVRSAAIEEPAGLLRERLEARPELAGRAPRTMETGVSCGSGPWVLSHWEPLWAS